MKILSDSIRVSSVPEDAAGNKLEPEEQVVERVLDAALPLTLNTGELVTENIPGAISVDVAAGEFAARMRERCINCVHFDHVGWMRKYHELRVEKLGDPGAEAFLNQIRAMVDQVTDEEYIQKHLDQATGDINQDHALQDLGLCRAMTEIWTSFLRHEHIVIVAPEGGCPDDRGPNGENLAALFRAKDTAAERKGGSAFDKIMRMAQGAKRLVFGTKG